jgi:MoaE-MoaD fusion protein
MNPDTITVRVRAFASLREALGFGERDLGLPAGSSAADLVAFLAQEYPEARLLAHNVTVAVNRAYAGPQVELHQGDEVALIPPVSGGAGPAASPGGRKLFEIVERPIAIDEVAARVAAPDLGGIVLFAGTVRGVTRGLVTDHLEYEAYAEMAEPMLAEIAAETRARWPAIAAVSIVHRVGRLEVGDIAVVIAVAAAHRQDTFDACRYVIDRIKEIAPIWKREVGADGAWWVEGPESLPPPPCGRGLP